MKKPANYKPVHKVCHICGRIKTVKHFLPEWIDKPGAICELCRGRTCSYCEFYSPFLSDIFDELMSWGECEIDYLSGEEEIQGGDKICPSFQERKNSKYTEHLRKCGLLIN